MRTCWFMCMISRVAKIDDYSMITCQRYAISDVILPFGPPLPLENLSFRRSVCLTNKWTILTLENFSLKCGKFKVRIIKLQKSLIQHCERSKVNGPFWRVFQNLKHLVRQCYQTGLFFKSNINGEKCQNSNATFWVIFNNVNLCKRHLCLIAQML